jgi:sucrose-6-phosphatase
MIIIDQNPGLSVSMGLLTNLSLLVTDLDNTLVGHDESLNRLNHILHPYRQTYDGIKLVYATGRSQASYELLQVDEQLLHPDALIAAVGTEIYLMSDSPHKKLVLDPEWENKLSENWNPEKDPEKVRNIASRFADLKLQPDSEQSCFKVSYHLSSAVVEAVVPQLQDELSRQGLDAEIIFSGRSSQKKIYTGTRKNNLDIIPRGGDKGKAMQFLRKRWQIDPSKTIVCGDSGNDISLFKYDTERGVIVSNYNKDDRNADSELRLWHELNPMSYHYLAHADCAEGILEGLKYFGFLA